jgi:hypothetical protein
VIIAGAGPAGLMAADALSAAGVTVTLHDAMPSAGRKFLMAGRGGLNLTHSEELDRFITRYGAGADWVAPWLETLSPEALRSFANELGQDTFTGSSGRVFPRAMKASPMLRAWMERLAARGVTLLTRSRFTGWDEAGRPLFTSADGATNAHACDALILAFGGASWPKLGSDGGWAPLLAARGVALTPFAASNAGVLCDWSEHLVSRHAGAVLKGVELLAGGQSARGDLIMTRTGLEGGPVYALSRIWRDLAFDGTATLRLRPDMTTETLKARLATARANQSASTILQTRLKLTKAETALLNEVARPLPHSPGGLARLVHSVPLRVTGLAGLDRAISSAGGIAREAVTPSLELKALPGVFVAGEMLDWDAPTGGYLLQATFASAVVAAKGVIAWLGTRPSNLRSDGTV